MTEQYIVSTKKIKTPNGKTYNVLTTLPSYWGGPRKTYYAIDKPLQIPVKVIEQEGDYVFVQAKRVDVNVLSKSFSKRPYQRKDGTPPKYVYTDPEKPNGEKLYNQYAFNKNKQYVSFGIPKSELKLVKTMKTESKTSVSKEKTDPLKKLKPFLGAEQVLSFGRIKRDGYQRVKGGYETIYPYLHPSNVKRIQDVGKRFGITWKDAYVKTFSQGAAYNDLVNKGTSKLKLVFDIIGVDKQGNTYMYDKYEGNVAGGGQSYLVSDKGRRIKTSDALFQQYDVKKMKNFLLKKDAPAKTTENPKTSKNPFQLQLLPGYGFRKDS